MPARTSGLSDGIGDVRGEDHADVARLGDLRQRRPVELGAVDQQDGPGGRA